VIIVAIAWLYVVAMVALLAGGVWRCIGLFVGLGLGPLLFLLWIAARGSRHRGRNRQVRAQSLMPDERLHERDRGNAEPNQQHLLDGGGKVDAPMQSGDQVGDRNVNHAGGNKAQQ